MSIYIHLIITTFQNLVTFTPFIYSVYLLFISFVLNIIFYVGRD